MDELELLVSLGEVVSGSSTECRLVDIIRKMFSNMGLEVKVMEVPVDLWCDLGAIMNIGDAELKAITIPPTLSASVDGRIVYVEKPLSLKWPNVSDSIVLCELPSDPDELKTVYLRAYELGAQAIIVYDNTPGRFRRVVISSVWDFRKMPCPPPPIPCIHIKWEDGLKVLDLVRNGVSRASLTSKSYIMESTGYNVEAIIPGSREDYIVICGHHDHWLTGVSDNLTSLYLLHEVGGRLGSMRATYTIRLVSFTAEEFGAPGFQAWYWAYGSRFYVENLRRTNRLNDVIAVVNVDAFTSYPLILAGTPEIRGLTSSIADSLKVKYELELDYSYCDSYSFSSFGIPAITIHSLPEILSYYHTDADSIDVVDWKAVMDTIDIVYRTASRIAIYGRDSLDYYAYKLELKKVLSDIGNNYLSSIVDRLNSWRAFRMVNMNLHKAVFIGDYRLDTGPFKTVLCPQLLVANDIKTIEYSINMLPNNIYEAVKLLSKIKPYIIPGEEKPLPSINVSQVVSLANLGKPWIKQLLEAILHSAKAAFKLGIREVEDLLLEATREY
ncbi:MAG: M28 family peptidase [Candidatus Methanomethylicia archaeon]